MEHASEITPDKAAGIPEERHDMIAIAAYHQAECRGFAGGYELEDWLGAEAEIDQRLEHGW